MNVTASSVRTLMATLTSLTVKKVRISCLHMVVWFCVRTMTSAVAQSFFNQYYIVFTNNIFTTLYFGNYFFSYILSKNVPVYHFLQKSSSYPLVQHSSSSPPLLNCVNTLPCEIHNDILTAIFQDNLGKSVPECRHSGFYWSKDDGGGCDSWSYSTCKAPVILLNIAAVFKYWHDHIT